MQMLIIVRKLKIIGELPCGHCMSKIAVYSSSQKMYHGKASGEKKVMGSKEEGKNRQMKK